MNVNLSLLDKSFMKNLLKKHSQNAKIELCDISYRQEKNMVQVGSSIDGIITIKNNGYICCSADWDGYPDIKIEVLLEIFKKLNLVEEGI